MILKIMSGVRVEVDRDVCVVCYNLDSHCRRCTFVEVDPVGDTHASNDALLNLGDRTVDELRELLDELYEEEQKTSYRRRVLHGKIDILRAELVRRLKDDRTHGKGVVSGNDIDRLIEILANDLRGVSRYDVTDESDFDDDLDD